LQAQLKTAEATARPKFLIELAKPTQKKNIFKPESIRDHRFKKPQRTAATQ
jgi:hypothetical protein